MIERTLAGHVCALARRHPVVTVTGPRQSGKTTLCRALFGDRPYASLEAPDVREFALRDPRGFLAQFPDGVVLDEVQRAPDLLSYLQGIVDARPRPGRFILTGSQHFGLLEAISQSLAGRTAIAHLLPLGLDEVRRFPRAPRGLFESMIAGGFPAIHDRRLGPGEWLGDYVATYVERDVRRLLNVGDLMAFRTFVRLCAGRSAQLVNLSALAADAGVTHNTARAWLGVLETSFLVFRLAPHHANLRKRLVKTPKLHLVDAGLLCHLLGVRTSDDLATHPLRGAIFETGVAGEIWKARLHRGVRDGLSFYRDRTGLEVDLLVEAGRTLLAVEAKSGRTVAGDFFRSLDAFAGLASAAPRARAVKRIVVHGGDTGQRRTTARVLSWSEIDRYDWLAGKE